VAQCDSDGTIHREGRDAVRASQIQAVRRGLEMFIQRHSEEKIRPDQVRAMARGLYYLAERDGITESEKKLLTDFLKEGDVDLDLESLSRAPFAIEELQHGLDSVFLRKTFLRVAVLMARSDGVISAEETAVLRRLAQALGIAEPLESLMDDLEGKTLE